MRALFVGLIFSSIHANAQIIEFKEDKSCVPETDNCFSTLKIKSANKTVQVDSLNGRFFYRERMIRFLVVAETLFHRLCMLH